MIRFSCPSCSTILQVADTAAGSKVLCSQCGQKLLVPKPTPPKPPQNKTVLGKLEETSPSLPTPSPSDSRPPSAATPPPLPAALVPVAASPEANQPPARNEWDFEAVDEAPRPRRRQQSIADDSEYGRTATKYCRECGQEIRARAEICPKCGVRQSSRAHRRRRPRVSRDGIKIPVLISAIFNIILGLFWAATCFGIIFTIPMIILCIFEFILWSQADDLSPRQLSGQANTLGILEIVVGLANTPTLICGIIVLVNSGKLVERDD